MIPDAALLAALRHTAVHLTRADLARHLRLDEAVVSQRLAVLAEAGFEIECHPGLGYRLRQSPDRLIADDLRARCGDLRFIRDILVFGSTDSTNQRGIDLGLVESPGGLAIFAESQTKGRGRFGRRWESAEQKGLWFSLLLRPEIPLSSWARLTTWAAVVVAETIDQCIGVRSLVKWPNDIEIGGRKVAGILIETMPDRAGRQFAVVGIGLNVNHRSEDFPPELQQRASSLRLAMGREIDRPALAARLLLQLEKRSDGFSDASFPAILAEAEARSSLLGRHIVVQTAGECLEGMVEGLAPDGRLVLRLASDELRIVGAGEASVVPTATQTK